MFQEACGAAGLLGASLRLCFLPGTQSPLRKFCTCFTCAFCTGCCLFALADLTANCGRDVAFCVRAASARLSKPRCVKSPSRVSSAVPSACSFRTALHVQGGVLRASVRARKVALPSFLWHGHSVSDSAFLSPGFVSPQACWQNCFQNYHTVPLGGAWCSRSPGWAFHSAIPFPNYSAKPLARP